MTDANGLPDGAQWLGARVSAGLRGFTETPHGHTALWLWGVTRVSLDCALQGIRMAPRRRGVAPAVPA